MHTNDKHIRKSEERHILDKSSTYSERVQYIPVFVWTFSQIAPTLSQELRKNHHKNSLYQQ